MPNAAQVKTYNFVREEIGRLRGPRSNVPLSLNEVTPLDDDKDHAVFRVNGARVFVKNSGEVVDDGLPDCPSYAECLLSERFLPAIAADLLREGNPHKPFLHSQSHTPKSFEEYLLEGTVLGQKEDALPFPIAIAYRKLNNAPNRTQRFSLLIDLFEVVIRLLVLVQIADHFRGPQQTAVLEKIPELSKLSKPSLGVWVSLFRSLSQLQNSSPFLKEIATLKVNKTLEDFVKLRNESFKGHGATLTEAEYGLKFHEHIPSIEELIRKVSFLKNYWLVRTSSMELNGDYYHVSVQSLKGDNPVFAIRDIRSRTALQSNTVTFLNPSLDPLVLDPYVILEVCKQCHRPELLLFDSFSEAGITYLGPEGHKPSYPNVDKLPQALREANRRHYKK